MTPLQVFKVDAFTTVPFAGNPAGVVPSAVGLPDAVMQMIAREMGLPETAFVLPPRQGGADLRLRWFTPTNEVPLCGHATIATFHLLASEGMRGMGGTGTFRFSVETASGLLPVRVEKTASSIEIAFGLPIPVFADGGVFKDQAAMALGLEGADIDTSLPVVRTSYLFIPVRRLETLHRLQPDFARLAKFHRANGIMGTCVLTTATVDPRSAVHSRFFAPNEGIPEDPVTGSSNGPLGVYLYRNGRLRASGNSVTLVGEQGDAIGRPGRVTIRLSVDGADVRSLEIAGTAVTVLAGSMQLAHHTPVR